MVVYFSDNTYYINGTSGVSTIIGYESRSNRVVRASFTTGDTGATNVSITVEAGCIVNDGGEDLREIPFYITTDQNSHANANASDGYAVTGYITGSSGKQYYGSADIVLKANTKYYLWFFPNNKISGWSYWHKNSNWCKAYCDVSGESRFTLTINAGDGSSITVNRTSSSVGLETGALNNDSEVYKDDKLKISFDPHQNYAIETHVVNEVPFTSGNTHTVYGNVNVRSTARMLSSGVGASDANIESTSTIIVTKRNDGYFHTLEYSFGNLSGYITNSGEISDDPVVFSGTAVSFCVPSKFYEEIPDSKTGVCTITCRTYENASGGVQLGDSTSCSFTVTAAENLCKPIISGSVVDCNDITKALTGNEHKLVRYKSNAQCDISVVGENSASIMSKTINGNAVGQNNRFVFNSVDYNSFEFKGIDSRGYSSVLEIQPDMVDYVSLTCTPYVYRRSPTDGKIMLNVSGNIYIGSFGKLNNTLKLQYRYRKAGEATYGDWITINSTMLTFGTSSYRSSEDIELIPYQEIGEDGETTYVEFDYRYNYEFQIRATDGCEDANGNEYVLSTVDKFISVSRGIPVFDWGEDDFNVNVTLMLNKVDILNIMHPVGSIYIHIDSELPATISSIGEWEAVNLGIDGIFSWKRTT